MLLKIFHIHITWEEYSSSLYAETWNQWLSLLEFSLLLPHSNLHKKTGIRFFSKKFLHKRLFKITSWHKMDDASEVKIAFPLSIFGYSCLMELMSRRRLGRGKGHWCATSACCTTVDTMWRNLQCLALVI